MPGTARGRKIFSVKGPSEGERRGTARGWFSGSEERGTTVKKVPHPRLMVQSGPGVLFAHLSTPTNDPPPPSPLHSDIVSTATLATRALRRVFFPSEVARGWLSELFLPSPRNASPRTRRRRRGGKEVVEGALVQGCAQYATFPRTMAPSLGSISK